MTKLAPNAKSALDMVNEKHVAYTIARTTIEQELKRELHTRLSSIRHERDIAIRLAADAGVPKTQLGKAIGTSNYKTIQDILASVESVAPSTNVPGVTGKLLVTAGENAGEFIVSLTNFGDQSVTGQAVVCFVDGEIEWTDGDAFVLPQIYRNNGSAELSRLINSLG